MYPTSISRDKEAFDFSIFDRRTGMPMRSVLLESACLSYYSSQKLDIYKPTRWWFLRWLIRNTIKNPKLTLQRLSSNEKYLFGAATL